MSAVHDPNVRHVEGQWSLDCHACSRAYAEQMAGVNFIQLRMNCRHERVAEGDLYCGECGHRMIDERTGAGRKVPSVRRFDSVDPYE